MEEKTSCTRNCSDCKCNPTNNKDYPCKFCGEKIPKGIRICPECKLDNSYKK